MATQQPVILTVNAGSSSLKLALFAATNGERIIDASLTNIGLDSAAFRVHTLNQEDDVQRVGAGTYADAIQHILGWLEGISDRYGVAAIGHRVVHGGPNYSRPVRVTDHVAAELERWASVDPAHAPAALELLAMLRQRFPHLPQVACLDTAFFHELPDVAQLLPLPQRYRQLGLRRYGFHGLSYTFLLASFRASAGEAAANGRIIMAHLGSGASLAALHEGKPVDTTMSFTPASGIVMSTRTGDLDPGIMPYLHRHAGVSAAAYEHVINFESGLAGVSGSTGDMYTLLQREASDPHAAAAVELFVHQAKKAIGALAAVLGGLDSLIFSGGIGEVSVPIRERICAGLEYLGVELDRARNNQNAEHISAVASRVGVYAMHTDEAAVIAAQTRQFMQA